MELVSGSYPVRAFIRHKAEQKIAGLSEVKDMDLSCPTVDQALLRDLAVTLFQSPQGNAVYQAYPTREAAEAVENAFARELAAIYQQITQRQADPHVQRLNQLLGNG